MFAQLVNFRTIHIGNTNQRVPVPTKVGWLVLLLLAYLLFSLLRLIWFHGDWKTYTSNQHQFSIDYPAYWHKFGEYENGYKNLHDLNIEFINGDALLFPTTIAVRIHHRTISNGTIDDLETWGQEIISITGGAESVSPLMKDHIGLDNYPVYSQIYEKSSSSWGKFVYLMPGDDAYILQLRSTKRRWDSATDIFDQMLASFQLPDPTIETND